MNTDGSYKCIGEQLFEFSFAVLLMLSLLNCLTVSYCFTRTSATSVINELTKLRNMEVKVYMVLFQWRFLEDFAFVHQTLLACLTVDQLAHS